MFEHAIKRVRGLEWSVSRAIAWLHMNGYKVSAKERQELEKASTELMPTV